MGGAKYVSQLIEQFKGYSNGLELAIAVQRRARSSYEIWISDSSICGNAGICKKSIRPMLKFSNIKHPLLQSSAKDAQKSDADTEKL